MKNTLILLTLLFATNLKAHQADISTTMLAEQESGNWQLIVATSLAAFEYEVKTHFGKDAFATPEEFEALVLRHLLSTISVRFNGDNEVALTSGKVVLGHETKVFFTIAEAPENMKGIEVINTAFADIHRNQSALVVLKKGVTKKQFMLDAENNHRARLAIDGNTLSVVREAGLSASSLGLAGLTGILLLALGTLTYRNRKILLPA